MALYHATKLLGWNGQVPNMADSSSTSSRAIAGAMLDALNIDHQVTHVGQTAGRALEVAVQEHLSEKLPGLFPGRAVSVSRKALVSDFEQYLHLASLQTLIDEDESATLKAAIGTDYLIRPDVTVGITDDDMGPPYMHAAVPCKWTLRSDRAQNVRHEAVVLIRHRRGRLPHIVPVTAEPLPTRIASLARGTAEVDAVYHVALEELVQACEDVGSASQRETLDELVSHGRLKDLSDLVPILAR